MTAEDRAFLNSLVGKTVEFTSMIEKEEADFDTGMRTKVLSWEDQGDGCIFMQCDFTGQESHNEPMMKPTYYDKNHEPRLRWSEMRYYPKDGLTREYFSIVSLRNDANSVIKVLP